MKFENLKQTTFSLEAEQSILGSLIVDYHCMEDIATILKPEHFYVDKYGQIFSEILEMYMTSAKINFGTVLNRVIAAGIYEETEAKQILYDMSAAVTSTKNAAAYARIVVEKANLRRLGIYDVIAATCYAQSDAAQNILDMAESRKSEICDHQSNTAMVELKTALLESFDWVSKIARDQAAFAGLQTNFWDLDRVLSIFRKGDMLLLASRPGIGKTSLALNIAQSVGLQGKSVAIFSLEESNEQMTHRLLSSHSGVDNDKLRFGELTDNERVRLGQSFSVLTKSHIYLEDSPNMTVAQMKAKLRRLPTLDLIIVDFVQLMVSGTRTTSRQEEVSEICRSMKMMAKEFNVPVLCLSQLSRASEKREGDKRPILSDLLMISSPDQFADVIMFLYHDSIYNKETVNPNMIELIIAKNRHGPTETVYLAWNNSLMRFSNYKAKKDANPLPEEAPPQPAGFS